MPRFETPQLEIEYWKGRCHELEREFDEYQQNSQGLEKELEASLEQAEKTIRDLRTRNNRLALEDETLKEKFEREHLELIRQIQDLQDESENFHSREENYVKYIRELEQKQDDLERLQRATAMSLNEFKVKFNEAIERNVLLESELDEKEILKTMVQRLMDETKDLKQEIQVRERALCPDNDKATAALSRRCSSFRDASYGEKLRSPNLVETTPSKTHVKSFADGPPMINTPTRVSAMNIVGDLLRKVGALESKLANCRTTPDSNRDSFRRGRLHRGISSPSINLVRS